MQRVALPEAVPSTASREMVGVSMVPSAAASAAAWAARVSVVAVAAAWALVEEPVALAQVLREHASAERCLLVDCLTLWLTNLLMLDNAERLIAEREALLDCLASLPGEIIFVSNETGMGVVPLGELTRRYVDEAGWLHQALAERCQRVVLTVAGLPLTLKGPAL